MKTAFTARLNLRSQIYNAIATTDHSFRPEALYPIKVVSTLIGKSNTATRFRAFSDRWPLAIVETNDAKNKIRLVDGSFLSAIQGELRKTA